MHGVSLRLDSSYRRPGSGAVVIAGSPLRVFRLTPGGVRVIEAIERGTRLPAGHERLTDRLLAAGAVHPVPAVPAVAPSSLTVVIPARGEWPRFRAVHCRTIVVDDASEVALLPPPDVPLAGTGDALTELLRCPSWGGPAGAREAGWAQVTTPYVAFVDTDVDVDEHQLLALAAHLDDPRVGLVAPRVLAQAGGTSVLQRYELVRSPLDLGPEPGRVAPGTRVAYVPAATLVCRVEALRQVGGFDPTLRYGEDVDLAWRLHEAGWGCRYEPAVVVHHRTRPTLRAFVEQRFRYGTSAGPLARRHPGALAPVRMSGWSAATWAAAAVGAPLAGLALGAGTSVALVRKLPGVPARESVRLAGVGHLWAGRLLAGTMRRAWWPLAAVAALASHRLRRSVLTAVAASIVLDGIDQVRATRHDPAGAGALDPLRTTALRVVDDLAYGAGVWTGAWRSRSWAALAPALGNWPPRRNDDAAVAAASTER